MKRLLLSGILLVIATALNAQIEEGFTPNPSGWILAQGASFTQINGNDVLVTPSGGGNNPAVIGTPAVNKISNTIKVCLDITPYTSNLNSKTTFPCATYMDVLFVKSSVTTSNDAQLPENIYARVDNYQLPTAGGNTCFTFNFPGSVTAADFKVVLSFHAACTQGGIKLVIDNVLISGVDDLCAGTCAPVALNDAFTRTDVGELSFDAVLYGSNLNYPVPSATVAVDATGTDNDQNDVYAHLQWSLVSGPSNGSVTVNADGTCTITRGTLSVKQLVFVYRVCDDGADNNFATTGDNLCNDATVTVNLAVSSTLPVLLNSFTAVRTGTQVTVEWTTATESNNTGFEIQRSEGGGAYKTLVFVPTKAALGNSSNPLHYEFRELNQSSQVTGYRLVQVDLDGRKTTYGVKWIPGMETGSGMRFSANPVINGQLTVYFDQSRTRDIMIIDMNGKIQRKWAGYAPASLQVSGLRPGMYTVLVTEKGTGQQQAQKLMIAQ